MNVLEQIEVDFALKKWRHLGGLGPVPAIANCGAGEFGQHTMEQLARENPVVVLAAQNVAERLRFNVRMDAVNAVLSGAPPASGYTADELASRAFAIADAVLRHLDNEAAQTTSDQP